ncbi:MAG: AAA family ATPase [Desulfobacteraceae bacterium]|jgi:chromosome partitioning protein|nr:AAA family ATPase [Desulfobacteraceae bacterium]
MGQKARVVAIANEKGGVGKTATVVNLSAALSLEGQRVLVIDMDPQHNTTNGLGIDATDDSISIYDLITNGREYKVQDAICQTQWDKLDLIPSHIDLSGAEIELVDEEGRENRLKEVIAKVTDAYDVIIMDTPPSLSLLTINVFAAAGEIVVPCQTHPYAYKALEDLFDTIEDIKEGINPGIAISGILPTFYDQRTRISRDILERLKSDDRYKDLLFDTPIRVNTTIPASSDKGKPVVFYRKNSYGANDYMALAREFIG